MSPKATSSTDQLESSAAEAHNASSASASGSNDTTRPR